MRLETAPAVAGVIPAVFETVVTVPELFINRKRTPSTTTMISGESFILQ
jgi:hypothetical protein